jgi:hypothetical protein
MSDETALAATGRRWCGAWVFAIFAIAVFMYCRDVAQAGRLADLKSGTGGLPAVALRLEDRAAGWLAAAWISGTVLPMCLRRPTLGWRLAVAMLVFCFGGPLLAFGAAAYAW